MNDIVGAVQEQEPATEEELRLALLCLYYDGQMSAPSDYESAGELRLRMRAKENFERRFRMLKADPSVYLGERWTPGTEENRAGRELSKRVLAKFEKSREKGAKP
ncbi:MAG TPA: hypothetical protein VFR23_24500 [Jiangellaceae bacterium]|nr:hypothetical protein [Jiangellaceae bacterium]